MNPILNLAGTFLGAHRPAAGQPPVITVPLDTTDLTPTLAWSRWGADPADGSVLYRVDITLGGSAVSLTGATGINGVSYTVAPALIEAESYDITVSATIGGVIQSTSASEGFIKPAAGDSLGLIQSATMKFSYMREADDHLYMQHTALPGAYTTLTDVNLATEGYNVETGMRGQPMPRVLIEHSSDMIFMGTNDPKSQLWQYTPSTGASVMIHDATPAKPFRRSVLAPDGQVWFGSDTNAFLSRYNPATTTFQSFPTLQSGRGYVYFLWVDNGSASTYHLVAVLSYAPWLLVVFNPRTEVGTVYHAADADTGGTLFVRNSDGALLYRRNLSGGGLAWESVIGGVVSSIATPGSTTYTNSESMSLGFSQTESDWAYDVNFAPASPTDITPAHIEYKLQASSTWLDMDITGITTSVVEPFKVRQFDADTFAIVGQEYVPPYFWTPSTDARTVGGFALASWYALCVDGTDIYLAGYDNWVVRWDTTQPWTLYPDHPTPATANPRKLSGTSGQWHYYCEKRGTGSSREIWTAAKTSRGGTGIYLNRYVPNTDVLTVFNIASTSTIVTGLVISTEGIIVALTESSTGKIKVINPSTGALTREYTTTNQDPGLLVKLSETEVLTVEDFRYTKRDLTDGTTDFAFTTTGELCGSHNYTYERWAELNGSEVRLQIGNTMYSINTSTGAQTAKTGGSATPKLVSWLGSTAYAWNINGFEVNP